MDGLPVGSVGWAMVTSRHDFLHHVAKGWSLPDVVEPAGGAHEFYSVILTRSDEPMRCQTPGCPHLALIAGYCNHHRTDHAAIRSFDSGATRDVDTDKFDYEGFLSPLVLERFAAYMHRHRETPAGLRASDNWQQGFPPGVALKSMLRHLVAVWKASRRGVRLPKDELCAIIFNAQAMLLEELKQDDDHAV